MSRCSLLERAAFIRAEKTRLGVSAGPDCEVHNLPQGSPVTLCTSDRATGLPECMALHSSLAVSGGAQPLTHD